ncbi:MAG: hypothetical protein WBP68_19830, partial [Candidatus Binatus sp.]
RIAGFTPLGDQIVAGAIMWVPGSIFYLVPAALIMFEMLSPQNLRSPLPARSALDKCSTPLPLSLLGRGSKVRVLIQRAFFARDSRF